MPEPERSQGYAAYRTLSMMLQDLVALRPLEETLDLISERLTVLMGFVAAFILLPDSTSKQLFVRGAFGISPLYRQAINSGRAPIRLSSGLMEGPSAAAFHRGTPVVVQDIQTDPSFHTWRALALSNGYRSVIAVPLRIQGRILGVIACFSESPREYSDTEQSFVQDMAAEAALATELARRIDSQTETIRTLEVTTRALEMQSAVLKRSEQVYRELAEVVVTGKGTEAIARLLQQQTGRPVMIWDQAGYLLFAAAGGTNISRWEGLLREPGVAKMLRSIRRRPRMLSVGSSHLMPVLVGGTLFGYVAIISPEKALAELDVQVLRHGTVALGLELAKRRIVAETEERLKGDFVHDLVLGRFRSFEEARSRGQLHGIDLMLPHRVAVLECPFPVVRVAQEVIAAHLPGALVAESDHGLIAVLPDRSEVAKLCRRALTALRSQAGTVGVAIGVGSVATQPEQLRRSCEEARHCLRFVRGLALPEPCLVTDELGILGTVLFNVQDPQVLRREATELFRPLVEADPERAPMLIKTLAAYLHARGDAEAAAKTLVVHRNTVRYRLQQVSTLLGVDLAAPHDLTRLYLAVLVTELTAP